MPATDKLWEDLAGTDPYWAVLVHDKFRTANIDDNAKREFFQSGENHVAETLGILTRHFGAPARFSSALDFGCGTGRLVIPLAHRSDQAFGVDIADRMREICAENARAVGLRNLTLEKLLQPGPPVQLVYSFIVLQHIPVETGRDIMRGLLRRLQPGGYGYLQFPIANEMSMVGMEAANTTGKTYAYYQRIGDQIVRLAGSESPEIHMQMNHYNLNELYCYFAENGITQHFTRMTNHGGVVGVEVFFQRQA